MSQPAVAADGPGAIGRPVSFVSGQLAGKTVRAVLREIQGADSGRKCYLKDRRPLDPPPICLLTLFIVDGVGTSDEREHEWENYADILPEGWLCHVSMFKTVEPVPPPPVDGLAPAPAPAPFIPPADSPAGTEAGPSADGPTTGGAENPAGPTDPDGPTVPDGAEAPGEAAGEDVTGELVGSTFVQVFKPDIDARTALVFPFTDIASKAEGTHRLRYRVFNIFALAAGAHERPVLAECMGAPFRVYNSRSFPGLRDITTLTKTLEAVGIYTGRRATIRKHSNRDDEPGSQNIEEA